MNTELRRAQRQAESSRRHVEEALSEVGDKVVSSYRRVERVIEKVKFPYELAARHPLANLGICLTTGFWIGSRIHNRLGASSAPAAFDPETETDIDSNWTGVAK